MSNSFSNQTLAQIELWTNSSKYENKVYAFLPNTWMKSSPSPPGAKIGVELDEPNSAEAALGLPKVGPFKPEHYRY